MCVVKTETEFPKNFLQLPWEEQEKIMLEVFRKDREIREEHSKTCLGCAWCD